MIEGISSTLTNSPLLPLSSSAFLAFSYKVLHLAQPVPSTSIIIGFLLCACNRALNRQKDLQGVIDKEVERLACTGAGNESEKIENDVVGKAFQHGKTP
jgi:hypothetical protein